MLLEGFFGKVPFHDADIIYIRVWLVKCQIIMQIYFKSCLVKCHKHHADKDLLVKCHNYYCDADIFKVFVCSVSFMMLIYF